LHAKDGEIAIEVLAQLDAHRVRGIVLTPTQDPARGIIMEDTGGPLKAPVGKGILSQMFDVFGNFIDRIFFGGSFAGVESGPPNCADRAG
jgi:F-type H+-transporting ATPase subunit beta